MFSRCLIVLYFLMMGCRFDHPEVMMDLNTSAPGEYIPLVKGYTANKDSFYKENIFYGRVRSSLKTDLIFKSAGVIEKLPVKNGGFVLKGDTICMLGNKHFRISLRQAQNDLKLAETELNSLLLGYGGKEEDSASVPPHIYKIAKLESGYSKALEKFHLARHFLDQTIITAPFCGFVSQITTAEGISVQPLAKVCRLTANEPLVVEFRVIPHYSRFLGEGCKLEASPLVNPCKTICEGKISFCEPSIDDEGFRTVYGTLDGSCPGVVDGMKIRIRTKSAIHGFTKVPKEALTLRSGRTIVFIIQEGRACWREVEILYQNKDFYLLANGIEFGDTVAINGNLDLTHNMPVKLESIITPETW